MYEIQMNVGKSIRVDADRFNLDAPKDGTVGSQFIRFYKENEEVACYVITAVAGWAKIPR